MMDLDRILQERFGLPSFRAGQREAIEALLRDGRLLVIQPTGHGKSLLFQLPAALLPGITLVVSPLLALMRDQLGQLSERFQLPAAAINSDQTEQENSAAKVAAQRNEIKLLYVAPEQLDDVGRFEWLSRLAVDLLVIDEAHCISSWGHDFRPSYRRIVELVHALDSSRPGLRVLAVTATADARAEADIVAQLGGPVAVHRQSMDRPNLRLAVVAADGLAAKLAYVRALLGTLKGNALIYCATRERTEMVANYLESCGLEVPAYHAGLESDEKRRLQQSFLRGDFAAIAATNALGMGIDKSDLRAVVHFDTPGSPTAYYQEVGRAGRDGRPALGALVFDPADARIHHHFIVSSQPTADQFRTALGALPPAGREEPPGVNAVMARSGLHPTIVRVILAELVEQGFARRVATGGGSTGYLDAGKLGVPDLRRYRGRREQKEHQLGQMLAYGRGEVDCLMAALRRDLGDLGAMPCGRCSACTGKQSSLALDVAHAAAWLDARPVVLAGSSRPPVADGFALIDPDTNPTGFRRFMTGRTDPNAPPLPPELDSLLDRRLAELAARHRFGAVISVPGESWTHRDAVASRVADALGVPWIDKVLVWKTPPTARQGTLLNNEQRRLNVANGMTLEEHPIRVPPGAILLLDDYTGSGATIKEAARVLLKGRKGTAAPAIVPLTIAKVRWKLGAAGMA